MKVLYIHGVRQFGGASRSLYELVKGLRRRGVEGYFIAPRGSARDYLEKVGTGSVAVRGLPRFNNSIVGYYRGLRWIILLRELFHLPFGIAAVIAAKRKWDDVQLIHVNEIHDLPTALVAKFIFGKPLVVHLRCCQRDDRRSWRVRAAHYLLRRNAAAIIAIDQNTRATLPDELDVSVVHNSFSAPHLAGRPENWPDIEAGRRPLVVGYVGNIMRSKGILDLVRAFAVSREAGANVRLIVAGGRLRQLEGLNRRLLRGLDLEEDVMPEVEDLIRSAGLESSVELLGHVDAISEVYRRMDVVAFPSYFDAPGRPIFEAAFFKVPSISCVSSPKPDTIRAGETGIVVPPRDPEALAEAIVAFAKNPREAARMGENAFRLALSNFDPSRNADRVLEIYKRVLRG